MLTKEMLSRVSVLALSAALIAAQPGVAPAATEIGSVAAVNKDIEGTPPGADARSLLLGDRLIANERLISSPIGSGQMLFLDQTSLTVSPNSDIVLDKYVYDPETEAGEIGVTVARGVLRMIGGRITKTTDAVVKTPTATIGIRGGIALVVVDSQDQTRIMHVTGEYTRINTADGELVLSRSNGLATASGGGVEFNGVATEEQIAELYDQMQGGGGGTEEEVSEEVVEGSGVADVNSEEPDAVEREPISTAGESAAEDGSAKTEQLSLASDTDIQNEIQDDQVTANPFQNFVGGLLFADNSPVTDASGATIENPAAQNYYFVEDGGQLATFSQGSLIATLSDGQVLRLPEPQNGFFDVSSGDTSTPEGPVIGRGFGDLDAGLFLYNLETQTGGIAAVFGAQRGPTQLRNINLNTNAIRATAFNIFPDLGVAETQTTIPFLPEGLGEIFDNGTPNRLFLLNPPNTATFGSGSGPSSNLGSKWLIPQFSIKGEGANQNYLLAVGATGVLNNGSDAPDMSSFSRGSFRLGGAGFANRIQPVIGTLGVPDNDDDVIQGPTVYGSGDNYLLLSNESAYHENLIPDSEDSASFRQNIATGAFDLYGNMNLAQRGGSQTLGFGDRFAFGSTPAAFAAERGLSGATNFAANQAVFNSYSYASTALGFRSGQGQLGKAVARTIGVDSLGGASAFNLQSPSGALILNLDEVVGDPVPFERFQLAFGGGKSAVIDGARFGMREHNDPDSLQNVLTDEPEVQFFEGTDSIRRTGRPPNQFGASAFRGAALSHGLADSGNLFPAGTDATPEFLTWGYWTGQFRFDNDANPAFDNARTQFALGTFVTGNRTDILPTMGTATYDGAVILNVLQQNGVDFVDGGRFQMSWNFGNSVGNVQLTGVLGAGQVNVPVSGAGALGFNDYGGNAIAGPNMTDFQIDGSFFDGPNNNDARATAGSIRTFSSISGRQATGTFFGER